MRCMSVNGPKGSKRSHEGFGSLQPFHAAKAVIGNASYSTLINMSRDECTWMITHGNEACVSDGLIRDLLWRISKHCTVRVNEDAN